MFGKNWLTGKLRMALLFSMLLLLVFPMLALAESPAFPALISLPTGFQPEGVATGRGTAFYTGSLSGMGIYRGDLRTGQGGILTAPLGASFAGMKVDPRTNFLFAAGGPTGKAWIFDASAGGEIAQLQLAPANSSFINDVILTRDWAYFTSSYEPTFYRIALGPSGVPVQPVTAQSMTLSGEWVQGSGFGANGIVATPNGRYLIIVNTNQGTLYRVDPATGAAQLIDLNGANVLDGDGLWLQGHTLYVVQNQLNKIEVFDLAPDLLSAQLVDTITNSNFDVPTTIASFGDYLYVVNAKFGAASPETLPYEIVQVRRGTSKD